MLLGLLQSAGLNSRIEVVSWRGASGSIELLAVRT